MAVKSDGPPQVAGELILSRPHQSNIFIFLGVMLV